MGCQCGQSIWKTETVGQKNVSALIAKLPAIKILT